MRRKKRGGYPVGSSTLTKPAFVRKTVSEEETLDLARALGGHLRPGDWVALMGELGTGKTVFVRGLGEALHSQQVPVSPTFSLVQIHRPTAGAGRFPLRHVDLYRLAPKEIPALEWEELLDEEGVTAVEWAEKAKAFWPSRCLPVVITHEGPGQRSFGFHVFGERSAELILKMKHHHVKT